MGLSNQQVFGVKIKVTLRKGIEPHSLFMHKFQDVQIEDKHLKFHFIWEKESGFSFYVISELPLIIDWMVIHVTETLTYCSNTQILKLFQKHYISFGQHLEHNSRNEYDLFQFC